MSRIIVDSVGLGESWGSSLQLASALFTAQNGDRLHLRPQITNGCGKKKAHKSKGHRAGK